MVEKTEDVKLSNARVTRMEHSSQEPWWSHLVWAPSAGVLGFVVAAVFAGIFHLPRSIYLIPYAVLTSAFVYAYLCWSRVDVAKILRHHLTLGLVGAVFVGFFTVQTVLIQPASPPPEGLELAFDLTWLGIVYGALDALLLSVLPVFATWRAMEKKGWTKQWRGRIAGGAFALVISLVVIGLYHLGYPEFRGHEVLVIMVGVGIGSLFYLITGNPLTPVLGHIAMHIAAILHGMNTVSQLPPHYQAIVALIMVGVTLT